MNKTLWRILGIVLVAGVPGVGCSWGQNVIPDTSSLEHGYPYGEWVRSGDHLLCMRDASLEPEPGSTEALVLQYGPLLPCQYFGPFQVMQHLSEIKAVLGEPAKIKSRSQMASKAIYVFRSGGAESRLEFTLNVSSVTAIKFSGDSMGEDWQNSGLRLGMPAAELEALWGPPKYKKTIETWRQKFERWTYHPFSVRVEVMDGKVVTIEIFQAGDNYGPIKYHRIR